MMSRIWNHTSFPNYTSDNLNKINTVMAQDLEYDIGERHIPPFRPSAARAWSCSSSPMHTQCGTHRPSADEFGHLEEISDVCTVNDLNINVQDLTMKVASRLPKVPS